MKKSNKNQIVVLGNVSTNTLGYGGKYFENYWREGSPFSN
jgi:hypothetical protein